MDSEGRGLDISIYTMLYLSLLTLWFHKTFKLIFLKPSSWPKTMYAEHWRKLAWTTYTFSIIIQYGNVFLVKNKFWLVILTFYFDLVPPFYFLKWNQFFSTFTPVLYESRQYFNYLSSRGMCTNLQIKRFPLIKYWYTVWMYGGSDFQINNIEKQ